MNKTRMAKTAALASFGALLLASCGGGGAGFSGPPAAAPAPAPMPPVSSSDIPQAATVDPVAAFTFVAQVAATRDDTGQPLRIGDARLATSETEDAKALR